MIGKSKKSKQYDVINKIGEGGMGVVLLAYDKVKQKNVVIKKLHQQKKEDRDAVRLFEEEINIYKKIDSNYIAQLYDVFSDKDNDPFSKEGPQYIVMEHIKGHTIHDLIKSGTSFQPSQIQDIALNVLKGLQAIHKENIIHRDITSNNVMLVDVDGRAKIIDFGISYDSEKNKHKQTHEIKKLGTKDYLPPELHDVAPNERFDIFSLGILMFELATGLTPLKYMSKKQKKDIKSNDLFTMPSVMEVDRDFPQALANVIYKATYVNSEQRYRNAKEMSHDLITCLDPARSLEKPLVLTKKDQIKQSIFKAMIGDKGKIIIFAATALVIGLVIIIVLLLFI